MKWPWVSRRRWEAKLDYWKNSYGKIEGLYIKERENNGSLYRENQKLLERPQNEQR